MRRLGVVALALVASALLGAGATSAAVVELPEGKIVERALQPGADAVFRVPLHVTQQGFLYVKLLVTPGNAVNDGMPNGTLAGEGWAVSYALEREDGATEALGVFLNSTPSRLVAVAADESPTLVVTVRVPADAAKGGPYQRVYLAVAYRFGEAGSGPGSTSGATMDEARSVTLLLSDALLPPVIARPPEDAPKETGDDGETPPPVTGIDRPAPQQPVVVQALLPTWFMVGVLALGAGMVIVLSMLVIVMARLVHASAEPMPRRIAVQTPAEEPPAPAPQAARSADVHPAKRERAGKR